MFEEDKSENIDDAPDASGSASSAEGAPVKGEKGKVVVDQGFVDRLVSERAEARETLAALKAEVEEMRLARTAKTEEAPPAPVWEDPADRKLGAMERELQGLKAREERREAQATETNIKGEYLENEAVKAVWPKWTDLQSDLKAAAKSHNLDWDSLSASRRDAVYNKVMRDNMPKIVEASRKSASVNDLDITGALPRGGSPKGEKGSDVKLSDLHKQAAKKFGISEERYLARVKEKMAAASSLEV